MVQTLALVAGAADAPSACRSVHLAFPGPVGTAFYNEVTVDRSAEGTYFMVCGFSRGYCGIQELDNGKKVILFSVWDPGDQDDPRRVDPDQRVQVLAQGEGVRVGRFGGEGTGGQSFYDFDWKLDQTYRFLITAELRDQRTAYAAYADLGRQKWQHLATFSTPAKGELLSGYYSFVEDFRRDGKSYHQARSARFGNGWVRAKDGQWAALTRARFTADDSKPMNVNAGLKDGRFFLTTGGQTRNVDTPLWKTVDLSPAPLLAPDALPAAAR